MIASHVTITHEVMSTVETTDTAVMATSRELLVAIFSLAPASVMQLTTRKW